tara:strand:- start:203 stop:580 length:378 start_codon:yes stop_codon:yes gene_type:complete
MTIKLKLNKDNILLEFMQSETGYWDDLKEGEKVVINNDINYSTLSEFVGYCYDETKKTFSKPNELKFKEIRIKRNQLLIDSDYTQLSDSAHKGTKEEWKVYRQKLRDITKDVTDPDVIAFPEEPK